MANQGRLIDGAVLRPDLKGYRLGDVSVDGFADRADVSAEDRVVIARLCRRYAADELSPTQRRLLRESGDAVPSASEVLRGFARNDADVASVEDDGFLEELSDAELAVVAYPALHPRLPDARYPLSIGELETVTGASARQLRHWADAGLLPVVRLGGQRRFFSAAVVRAFVLVRSDTYEVSALASIARADPDGLRLVRLVASTAAGLASRDMSPAASAPFIQAARTLADLPASMHSHTKS